MNVRSISDRNIEIAQKLDLGPRIIAGEADMLIQKNRILVKRFRARNISYEKNKILTINTLIDQKDILSELDIILPSDIICDGERLIGYEMPYIENNINLSNLLDNNNVGLNEKIEYLKDAGRIIEHVHSIKKEESDFFLCDVHAGNFIIDTENNNKLFAIDIDSCKIANNLPFNSLHLAYCKKNLYKLSLPKYKFYSKTGEIIPNRNTDLLCYIMMILEFISNGYYICSCPVEDYYDYLNKLNSLGLNKNLIDAFEKIYLDVENVSPLEHLDYLKEIDLNKTGYSIWRK